MKVNIIIDEGSWFSFRYVSKIFAKWLREFYDIQATISYSYNSKAHNILIEDTWNSIIKGKVADIYWSDTANPISRLQSFYRDKIDMYKDTVFERNYAVSNSNKELMEKFGIRVDDIIPRLINNLFYKLGLNTNTNLNDKEYDVIFIGNLDHCDRKNIKLALDIAIKLKLKAVFLIPKLPTWYRHIPDSIKILKYGDLSDEDKAKLIAKSKYLLWLSWYEGFGMPVLEAMALSVPVIYSNCPAHNEFAIGFSIEPERKYTTYCYGSWVDKYAININTVMDIVNKALSIDNDEYKDLCHQAYERATDMYNEFVDKVDMLLEV